MTYDREKIDGLGSKDVMKLINKHMADVVPDLQRNMDYYLGKQAITERERTATAANVTAPNAQPVCNHAKDISDTASSYFLGTPLSYSRKAGAAEDEAKQAAFDALLDALDKATTDDDDQENALMLSICGKTF